MALAALENLLRQFTGTLLVASHDEHFLARIAPTARLHGGPAGWRVALAKILASRRLQRRAIADPHTDQHLRRVIGIGEGGNEVTEYINPRLGLLMTRR